MVDANHAPATVLATIPGISTTLAHQIVTSRDSVGGFRDLSDMSITLGITPQTLDEAATFLVFPGPERPTNPKQRGPVNSCRGPEPASVLPEVSDETDAKWLRVGGTGA